MDLFDLEPTLPDAPPNEVAWSFRQARILQVAVRLRLFDALAERAQSSERLAQTLDTDAEMTERLLVALAALGLVVQDEGRWRNRLAAALHLVRGQPLYQGDDIERAADTWELYHHLEQLVREGSSSERFQRWRAAQGARGERHLRALHALALAGQAQRLARLLSALGGRRTLLDVGGAPGSYSLALCQRYPALRVTLLDHTEALAVASKVLQPFAERERIALKEGAWEQGSWAKGEYEALLLSEVLVGQEAQALTYLLRAYEALRPGGLLIVQSFLLDNDLNGPRDAALFHLVGNTFTLEQMRALLGEAGFEQISLLFRATRGPDILSAHKPLEALEEEDGMLMEYISPEQELFAMMGLGEEESDGLTIQRRMWTRLVQSN